MIFKKTVASESCHFYDKSGNPVYEVQKAKGDGMRPTTLADARKMNLVPSVTTILKLLAKPGLEEWKLQNAMLAALTLPRNATETDDEFISRLIADSKEQAGQAAALGTRIHTALEKAHEGKEYEPEFQPYVSATMKAIEDYFGHQKWVAERSFAHPKGYGGKIDLSAGQMGTEGIVIDFKTTAFDADKKDVGGYDEHLIQLCSYAEGLGLTNYRLANVYVSTSAPGLVRIKEWDDDDKYKGWAVFERLIEIWQTLKGYRP